MNNFSTTSQMRQYEIEQAKKRMGTYAGAAGNAMTNTTAGAGVTAGTTNVGAQSQLKPSEKMQAKEDINKNTMY
ncbi:hypothetical protein [Paramaledivibacter caminithermalis]|jgi:hypothetical protein|uniref:Uncharacterized protein n=1 Tax=Paramaledivibacter caminithermalis (strain DSM 15212 / CIP 107654 / DViRD3) TaxID=1121301 RepID=A0A1M6PS17_PARC5|nr:hypothetical protein [Paramaledivibacter caminithermalis]SHK10789.1 hypothetical protein SAMN02745912_02272 [Paramaledivibacter caminithermalis DSM 15212]